MVGRGLRDLLAMLVHAGKKENIVASRTAKARLHVAKKRAVRGAKMRFCVDIVNGRGDEIRPLIFGHDSPSTNFNNFVIVPQENSIEADSHNLIDFALL